MTVAGGHMRTQKFTIYAKESGVEIAPTEKKQQGKPDEGRIALRFFRLATGAQQIRFLVEPWQAFDLCKKMEALSEGGKETLTHKFEAGDGETISKLSVECYVRNGKKGFALSIQRGDDSINVPAQQGQFLFAAEFLKKLSVEQSWVDSRNATPGVQQ
jgi:hypothetical protein